APLLKFKELSDAIINGPYKKEALVPSTPWFNNSVVPSPNVLMFQENDKMKLSWTISEKEKIFQWVVYFKYGEKWNYTILNKDIFSYEAPLTFESKSFNDDGKEVVRKFRLTQVAVSAVDRISNESKPAILSIK
ncbi:MAG: hypothetical protein CVV24_15125, partial [Ignavibacteriae bacterium HGW-Ignavibacteriae-3]